MLRKFLAFLLFFGFAAMALAQQAGQPEVKLNVLNVCSPSPDEQQQLASALSKIPKQPTFGTDFEVDRGRSTLDASNNMFQTGKDAVVEPGGETATWVRMRHEFLPNGMFSSVQYSFSLDSKNMVETLVFRVRDAKELLSIAIEDSASAITSPATMLAANTPASRIKLERMGKSSVVLARCTTAESGSAPDQSKYEPIFQSASNTLADYRALLGVKNTVPSELARTQPATTKASAAHKSANKSAASGSPPK